MRNAFILHGIYGNPEENWNPWLKKELEALELEVHVPHFPTIEPVTSLQSWNEAWQPYEPHINEESIIVGHSLRVAYGLGLIERHPVHAAFFIATAWGKTDNTVTSVMHRIADQPFDWASIRDNCHHFEILHADNDPYLPVERAETLATNLHIQAEIIEGAGHFNEEAGYTEFPMLLEKIKRIL